MKKYLLSIYVCALTAIAFFAFPLSARAFTDEGPALWNSGGNIMERFHSEVTGVLGAPSVAIPGLDGKYIIVRASPITKEFILGVQDSAGILHVYHSSDGITWTSDWTVTLGDGNVARFDIAYEQTTGRAVIAYRGRIAANKTTFYYRIWNGTSWTAQTEKTGGPTSGNITALKLASRPNSNQIGLSYFDDTSAGSAAFWSGSTWAFYNNRITTAGSQYTGYAGTYPPLRAMDVAFESLSGDMLVVMGENSNNRARWLTRSAAGAWSAVGSLTTLSGYGDYSRLVSSPTTNEIAYTSCMKEPTTPAYLCDLVLWTGTGFGTVVTENNVGLIADGEMPIDALWLVDGTNRAVIAVYENAVTNGLDWYLSNNGGNFVSEPTDLSAPTIISSEGQIFAMPIAGFPSQGLFLIDDASNAGYMKRATLSGTTVTWESVAPGSVPELTSWAYPVPSNVFGYMGIALQLAPSVFVVNTTATTTAQSIPSGSTQYIADMNCTDATSCSGYSFTARGKNPITLSRIMLTNSGTVNLAQTNNWTLDIDTDANPNNGITRSIPGTVSGNTITFTASPSLTLNAGERLYAFPKATFGNGGAYPSGGQTITLSVNSINDVDTSATPINDEVLIGAPTVRGIIVPNITGYTNTSEPTLNYSASCIDCGGRIGASTLAQSITINGYGFGADPGVVNRNSSTMQVAIVGSSTTPIASSNVSSWSNTSITILLDSSVTGNTDVDFGNNYGGAGALSILSGGVWSSGVNFFIFPQITGLIVPPGLGPDGAKEFNAADTDGVITILGTRMGATQGASTVQILGCSVTTCTSPTDSVVALNWSDTAIQVEVPVVIPDNSYSGSITLSRYFPISAAATVSYANTFSIRPRVLTIAPTSGGGGDAITLSGDHFCPTLGTCPTGTVGADTNLISAPAFSSLDNIIVAGVTADYWNSWTDTQIQTQVPLAAPLGSSTAQVTAGGFPAGQVAFSVVNNNIASPPINETQYATTTQNTSMLLGGGQPAPAMSALPTGGSTAASSVFLGGIITSSSGRSGLMRLAVEVLPVGAAFVCGQGQCSSEIQGVAVSGPATVDCSVPGSGCSVNVTLGENAYHWRARTEFTIGGTTYYSAWISYPSASPNLENAADFLVDRTPPAIMNITSGTPGTNSATISWSTNEPTTQLIELNKTGTFTDNCAASDGCVSESLALALSHSASLSNLDSNTLYYYRIYAADGAGNHTWSSVQQFTTLGVTQPAKTLFFHVLTHGEQVITGQSATGTFAVVIPETGTQFQSIFVDLRGIYQTSGSAANSSVSVQVNSEAPISYTLPGGYALTAPWRLYHHVSALNISPGVNMISITAGPDTILSSLGADIIVTYLYTP